jgi:isoleucyl-tRNA synthetase
VPIPALACQGCQHVLLTPALVERAAGVFDVHGADAWYERPLAEFVPEGTACPVCGGTAFDRETNILDVWFDSGSTFSHVLGEKTGSHPGTTGGHDGTGPEADLYLEGHDQHRGWFHSSLLIACATEGHAPYKGLLTHGFTVDGSGRKMSKSLGNYMPLAESAQKYGGEILRLWCAATDYSGDLAIDDKILARVIDAYRRIRNTLRFLLANTSDFDAKADAVPLADLLEIDRWALARAAQFQDEVLAHYAVYEFHPVVAKLQVFCSEDLGAFYLDVLKDRLYTSAPKSLARRSAQTALWQVTHAMLRWMAPFLSFTAEEAWKVFAPGTSPSIFVETYSDTSAWRDDTLLAKWARIRTVRDAANKEIEALRAAGQVGSSLQAELAIGADIADHAILASLGDDLKFVTITSKATLEPADALRVTGTPSKATKCERCWHYRDDIGIDAAHPALCGRCVSNLYGSGETRRAA